MGNSPSNNFDKIDLEQLEILHAEKYFGLVNFGNTCYCNSVLQALYFCKPFRERIILYKLLHKKTKDTLLASLADLFYTIASQKKSVGSIAPKKFIARLRKEYENFNNYMQQDAHEFLNYLLNDISEILTSEHRERYLSMAKHNDIVANNHCNSHKKNNIPSICNNINSCSSADNAIPSSPGLNSRRLLLWVWAKNKAHTLRRRASHSGLLPSGGLPPPPPCALNHSGGVTAVANHSGLTAANHVGPWGDRGAAASPTTGAANFRSLANAAGDSNFVNDIFRGQLAHETRCLNCESVSSTVEVFYDISVDVGPNTSITHCLRSYSNVQTLMAENKYECKTCNCKQEAHRRTSIKKLPLVLALHLKRFKMDPLGQPNKFTKVSFKVIFPLEIRLPVSPTEGAEESPVYELVSIIVHCGTGLNRGHYISIVKSLGNWLLFDDDVVETIDESAIQEYFGISSDNQKSSDTAYILFYQAVEWRSL